MSHLRKNSELIYNYLKQESKHKSSKSVVEYFKKKMDQSTVYRNLTYLENNNLIDTFTYNCSKNGNLKYFFISDYSCNHFLHCQKCHCFQVINSCSPEYIKELEIKNKVKILNHIEYFKGICKNCLEEE